MKRFLPPLLTTLLFLLILLFPGASVTGAGKGLLLWFDTVLPTLLPFIILSRLLIETKAIDLIARFTEPLFSRIFHVSGHGAFVVITGFLCGYPMGSKLSADLLRQEKISYREASYLLSFCNNTSPMFIVSFLLLQNLKKPSLVFPSLAILMGAPILCSFLFRKFPAPHVPQHERSALSSDAPELKADGLLDRCIMNGFETITKIGGYMMLFTILIELGRLLPFFDPDTCALLLSPLEVTTGIGSICKSSLSFSIRYVLSLALTSFGGFCSIAQTGCMIQGTSLSLISYTIQKLVTAGVTSLFALCYLVFFY